MALFVVNLWTIAAAALALILAVRRPAAAAGPLPAAMVGMGIRGLVVASNVQGTSAGWPYRGTGSADRRGYGGYGTCGGAGARAGKRAGVDCRRGCGTGTTGRTRANDRTGLTQMGGAVQV